MGSSYRDAASKTIRTKRGNGSTRQRSPGVWEIRVVVAFDAVRGRSVQRSFTVHGDAEFAKRRRDGSWSTTTPSPHRLHDRRCSAHRGRAACDPEQGVLARRWVVEEPDFVHYEGFPRSRHQQRPVNSGSSLPCMEK